MDENLGRQAERNLRLFFSVKCYDEHNKTLQSRGNCRNASAECSDGEAVRQRGKT